MAVEFDQVFVAASFDDSSVFDDDDLAGHSYRVRHRPETTLLYQIVHEYWPEFQAELASQDKYLPAYITQEFEAYLKGGRLEHGFLRVRCEACHDEKLVAFSCKHRGFCSSCGARRMADSAALLVDEILPHQPMRQLSPGMACSRAI